MPITNTPIAILEDSYIISRGIADIISDYKETDIIFLESADRLIDYLIHHSLYAAFINPKILDQDRELAEKVFVNKGESVFVAMLHTESETFTYQNKYEHCIPVNHSKDFIVPVIEKILTIDDQTHTGATVLSNREIEVLKLVAYGYTNKTIAEKLFLSTHTVISHRKNITAKLGINTVAGLAVYAVLNNLIPKDVIR